MPKRVLFAGYAPVHALCFLPVYKLLRRDPRVEVWLSGGFREKLEDGERYHIEGFYDGASFDSRFVLPLEEALPQEFDVAICAHTSDTMFPRVAHKTVQIFHGVSFKNFAVREKVLAYDFLCIPGRYHAERFREHGLVRENGSRCLLTGFAKMDALVNQPCGNGLVTTLGLDPNRPTLLYAPTGGKHNSLESIGPEIIREIRDRDEWNLLVKPHDHPKKPVDWNGLSELESRHVRMVRDLDVIPYLKSADLLLTDASSVAIEYTLLDRPLVFIDVPKMFKNILKRGAPLDLETHGRKMGDVAGTTSDVVEAVHKALANPEEKRAERVATAQHVFYEPGNASRRVADVVLYAAGILEDLPPSIETIVP